MTDKPAKMGRPTKFNKVFNSQVEKLASKGATVIEIADFLGVSIQTFYTWQKAHKEFLESYQAGREALCDMIEKESILKRALGYVKKTAKMDQYTGEVREVEEEVIPDWRAGEALLKVHKPEKWTPRANMEHSGEITVVPRIITGRQEELDE